MKLQMLTNREGKWPLPVQFLVFLLFEVLFIWNKYQASALVYAPAMTSWAMNVFGVEHFDKFLTLLSMLVMADVCAWHIGFQRYITFGGHTPRRWTILPITLGYLALSLVSWLLGQVLLSVKLPLLTDSMLIYTAVHSILYAAIVVVFCALIHACSCKQKGRAGLLTAVELALVLLLTLCSAASGQIQQGMLEEAYNAPASQQVTVTTFSVSEDEGMDELLAAILANSDLDAEDVTSIPADEALSHLQAAPFAAYEEAMAPANCLGNILQWVQLIPIFFAMKRWLFPYDDMPKEAAS